MMRKLIGIVFLALTALLASCGGGGGYAGNTGPTNALRMTPLLSAVTIPVGYFSDVGTISNGVAPYFILSSDPSVGAELLKDGTVRVRGLRDGTSTIAIQDSSVAHTSISFTVTAKPLELVSSIGGAMALAPNQAKTFSVSGGLAPFSISSSDDAVVTVSGANGTYTAVGRKPGSATLLVTDSVGTRLSIAVTVSVSDLAVSPSSGTDVVGGTLVMSISGGLGPYSASVLNPGMVNATITGSSLTLGLRAVGSTVVTVTDSLGSSVPVSVTVKALTMASSIGGAMALAPNQAKTFSVSGGLAPFSISSSDDAVVTVSGANGTYTAVGRKPGSATLLVTDSVGTRLSIAVTVSVSDLAVSPSSGTDVVGGTLVMSISGGLGPYSASVLNPGMVNATITGSSLTLGLRAVGSTVVTVTDSLGSSVPVSVAINASRLAITPASRTVSEKDGGGNVTFAISGDAPPFQVSIATSDGAFVTGGSVAGSILTVNLGATLCVSADRSVPLIVTDAFGTVSIATVLIKDQGVAAGGAPLPCP